MSLKVFHFSNSLIAFICSINFMFLCSYCATLGKLEGKLGEVSCNSEKDCVPNAYCIDNRYCMCDNNFIQDSNTQTCLPRPKKINDTCKIDVQCTSSFGTRAYCFKNIANETGQCRCMKNTHFQDGLCYKSVRLGGTCKVSDNCVSSSNVATYCACSVCVCAANFHPSDDRLDCLPDIALGKVCRKDEDCVADKSYCSGVCTCQSGYVMSSDGSTCLLAAKQLRAQCAEDAQCKKYLPNTFCDTQENNCKCVPFSHEQDKSCWMSAKLGEICSHPYQCTTPSQNRSVVSCTHGVCTCAAGYTRTDAECVKLRDMTAESSSVEKCVFLIVALILLSVQND